MVLFFDGMNNLIISFDKTTLEDKNLSSKELTIDEINDVTNKTFSIEVSENLNDRNIIPFLQKTASYKKSINNFEKILIKNEIEKNVIKKILDDYMINLIPAGTKGVIRGNLFNQYVKDFIINLKLNNEKFNCEFEKKSIIENTDEIPDWIITDKTSNRVLIGMNQLDLWGGGAQHNRGSKYLLENKHNNEKSKLVCVIANKIIFNDKAKGKTIKLFKVGYKENTLCYIGGLKKIIFDFFRIQSD